MLKTLVGFIADLISTVIHGWVLSLLWLWFLVPLGLPTLAIAHAIGIGVLVGLLTNQYIPNRDSEEEILNMVAHSICQPLILLTIGYIAKSFM